MRKTAPTRYALGDRDYSAYRSEVTTMPDTHWHSHFLLNLVVGGQGQQEVNGQRYSLQEGSVILLSPMDFHRNILENGKSVHICAVKFSDKIFYDAISDLCDLSDFPVVSTLSAPDFETAKLLFSLLLQEQAGVAVGSEAFAQSLIQQLAILTLRSAGKQPDREKTKVLRRALSYIHYHFRSNIRASDVAAYVGYSPNYFSTEFKKQTGMTYQKYLQDLRLTFAAKLLQLSCRSVTEVCFECGFNTLPHFSQAFKKRFGVSPDKYKLRRQTDEKLEKGCGDPCYGAAAEGGCR